MSVFSNLNVWRDETDRSVAAQMAVDEAILRKTTPVLGNSANLRFYLLPKDAVTLGFFMPISEIEISRSDRVESLNPPFSIVRRLTGGGIVFHGSDVTFSLAVGKENPLSSSVTADRYQVIHEALRDSLVECNIYPDAELVLISSNDSQPGELACFSKPVGWDVLNRNNGEKIAGGAQRRSGGAWLHQGTVQIPGERSLFAEWTDLFSKKLGTARNWDGSPAIEIEASNLEKSRYSSLEWNERL
ncbi:hypothetical protein N8813_04035 [bacterium]|nr:hypothetical protein [bacterium]MDB4657541.1 hypothetical protein [Verrucomicrobiales bacterium]MDC0258708.1 hypothetical protein [Verrucomicrobiales bacterium]MDC0314257.1 hypothetical protein [bacterium]